MKCNRFVPFEKFHYFLSSTGPETFLFSINHHDQTMRFPKCDQIVADTEQTVGDTRTLLPTDHCCQHPVSPLGAPNLVPPPQLSPLCPGVSAQVPLGIPAVQAGVGRLWVEVPELSCETCVLSFCGQNTSLSPGFYQIIPEVFMCPDPTKVVNF